jgi:peptidoglycan lytic transglycosylase
MPRALQRRSGFASVAALITVVATLGCATTGPLAGGRMEQVGVASYYGREHDGRRTASGEVFDMNDLTAAHRTLPFGTRVRVTNLANGREVTVRINDRGPFRRGRILDLSYAAARKLGMVGRGVAKVRVAVE